MNSYDSSPRSTPTRDISSRGGENTEEGGLLILHVPRIEPSTRPYRAALHGAACASLFLSRDKLPRLLRSTTYGTSLRIVSRAFLQASVKFGRWVENAAGLAVRRSLDTPQNISAAQSGRGVGLPRANVPLLHGTLYFSETAPHGTRGWLRFVTRRSSITRYQQQAAAPPHQK